MNVGRAIEIMNAGEIVHVSYKGEQIFIQNVDEDARTARIYTKNNPDQELEVDVLQLIEEQ
ncbi:MULTISPECIES: H-type small acid-soluble spore protein [Bacillaceae]|uniref:H-type small acid-soluble spore protein n=1 Tax=Bacillaceae TaxID=186817 RepID=UPI001E5E0731|nr:MULTISPECIES: H-type small acid-soluble spore protein [Bacillaceae]MCE4047865.1 H-type small acid-soluble spore protein [Bacillus sp. Au-Bac7]MCM3033275.1 H-type small acid-soluble spore protein [Niallia sp. MER 6]MDL0434889.1 H-type small acid-soluble spore protein [Niallia sp. SS-2023]UPO89293.1 H-type small acid-soluble spore protein [Niallia sp. Man26]